MSARNGEPPEPEEAPEGSVPDSTPEAPPAGGPEAGASSEGRDPASGAGPGSATGSGTDSGASAITGRPAKRRRGRVTLVTACALILVMVAALVLPVTRNGLMSLWCEVTGGICPGEPLPPVTEDEESDWRVRMEPEDAALWGNYVALGDSYSSGDGAGEYEEGTAEPGECWRSDNAYPNLIEQEFSFEGALAFYACSSHRGAQMLDQIGAPESQIERATEHTSLVTVGIGGNDLGFIPVLRTCMVRMPLLERTGCTDQEDEITGKMDAFEEILTNVLSEIRERAPDARVLVLGYPRLFPEEPSSMYYTLSVSDQLWLNTVAQRLNDRIRDTVYRADGEVYGSRSTGSVEFVNVFSALNGYEVSAEDAWLNGIVLGQLGEGLRVDRATFHPTAEGQRSIAERVRLQILEGPERVLYTSRETLENADSDVLTAELGGPLDPVHPEERPGEEAADPEEGVQREEEGEGAAEAGADS